LIDKRGITPTYFDIEGNEKEKKYESVSISFNENRITVYSYSHVQNKSKIIFSQIRDIIESRISKIYKILNPRLYIFILIFLTLLFLLILTWLGKERAVNFPSWIFLVCVIPVVATIVSGVYRDRIHHVVILKRKHEGGFGKQNSDKIWLLIIGALIGIFIKFIWDLIAKAI
jgi:amino acid transporter